MADACTSRELVCRALAGQPTERPAVGPLAVHYCARLAGVSLRDYTSDANLMADCVARYYERFQPDAVWLSADTWVTAEAMGAPTAFAGEDQPKGGCGTPLVSSAADLQRVPPPDVGTRGRYPLMLEALQRLRRAVGPDVFIVACFDQYPFALACELLGSQEVMLRLADDRGLVEATMERGLQYTLAYGRALAAAGADMLSGGDSLAGLIGPRHYRQVAWPWQRRLIEQLQAETGLPVSLHICGNATPVLADMAATGANVLEVDYPVRLSAAVKTVPPTTALWGNLDPVRVLAQSSPAAVRSATRAMLDEVRSAGGQRFVASSGCTLAVETPPENLVAMIDEARRTETPLAVSE